MGGHADDDDAALVVHVHVVGVAQVDAPAVVTLVDDVALVVHVGGQPMTHRTPKALEPHPDPTPTAPASRGGHANRPSVDAAERRRQRRRKPSRIEAAALELRGVAENAGDEALIVKALLTRAHFAHEVLAVAAVIPAGPARVDALRTLVATIRAPPRPWR